MKLSRVLVFTIVVLTLTANVWAGGAQEPGEEVQKSVVVEKTGVNATYNFFNNDEWDYLDDHNSVYQTMTYDQMKRLFESEGTFMVLFGGSWCGNTQSVISQINEVAKEYSVETIYNFDWRVDGESKDRHLRDNDNEFNSLYVDMVSTYLSNIVTESEDDIFYVNEVGETVSANKMWVPFLMIYNKDNKDANGNPAPVMASFEEMYWWPNDFQTDGKDDEVKIEAYRAKIRPLFDYISKDGVAQLNYYSTFEYFKTAYNEKEGATIFDSSDESFVFETVSYKQMKNIFESEGNFVVLFGGPWCGNTRAVVKLINEYANKYNIDTIYNYDTRFDNNKYNIRDTKNPYANMYVDMVKKYMPGIITTSEDKISYINEAGETVEANKLWVPYLFAYNKDNPNPILGQVELMFRWSNIQPNFVDEDGVTGVKYKAYTEALDALFSQL